MMTVFGLRGNSQCTQKLKIVSVYLYSILCFLHREKQITTDNIWILELNVFNSELCYNHLKYSDVVSEDNENVILAYNIKVIRFEYPKYNISNSYT